MICLALRVACLSALFGLLSASLVAAQPTPGECVCLADEKNTREHGSDVVNATFCVQSKNGRTKWS